MQLSCQKGAGTKMHKYLVWISKGKISLNIVSKTFKLFFI